MRKDSREDYFKAYYRNNREKYRKFLGDHKSLVRMVGLGYEDGLAKTAENRRFATYDPLRDGYLQHADLTASIMGDPPVGRRAIDGVR